MGQNINIAAVRVSLADYPALFNLLLGGYFAGLTLFGSFDGRLVHFSLFCISFS